MDLRHFFLLLLAGGSVYVCIELLWRERSHGSMFLCGGLCTVLIGMLNEWAPGLALTALIVCGIVYLMTKNGFVSLILAAVLEAGLIGGYLWDSSRFEGLFPQIISQLSLFARFYTIVNGVFDVTAIVYYLSVTGFFLFLSVQSLEKRRWSE